MATLTAFVPLTNTVPGTPSASTNQVSLAATVGSGMNSLRVSNGSTQDVFINFGTNGSVTAAVPTLGNPNSTLHVPAKDVEVFLPPWGTTNVAFIQAVAGSGNIFFIQGEGL